MIIACFKRKMVFCFIVLFLIFNICSDGVLSSVNANDDLNDDSIIAKMDDKVILYSEIRVSKEIIDELREKNWSEERINKWKKLSENRKLQHILEKKIVDKLIKKYDIKISKKEIDSAFSQKMLSIYGKKELTSDDINTQNKNIAFMTRLLETWSNNHQEGEKLYKQQYSEIIMPKYWEELKKQYPTPESVEEFKQRIPVITLNEIKKKIYDTVQQELKHKKLIDKLKLLGEIKTEKDFREWMNRKLINVNITHQEYFTFYKTLTKVPNAITIENPKRGPKDIDGTHIPPRAD